MLDTSKWPSGNKRITIYAVDTNDRIGTSSTVYYVAPKPKFDLVQREPAILGKSVLISIALKPDENWRPGPITVNVQVGASKTGPWKTIAPVSLDTIGQAAVRLNMEKSAQWVRVTHDVQDSLQKGNSQALALKAVPDLAARKVLDQSGTRIVNEDGTTPEVICSAPGGISKLRCQANNVQDSNQPIYLQVLKNKSWKNIKKISLDSNLFISSKPKLSKTGKASYRLNGMGYDESQKPFTPWVSNTFRA